MPRQKDAFRNRLVFVWPALEFANLDQCEAVAQRFAGRKHVISIEYRESKRLSIDAKSKPLCFQRVTLFPSGYPQKWQSVRLFLRLVRVVFQQGSATFFFENYEDPAVWLVAISLRLLSWRTYVLSDSKFDDEPRGKLGELRKFIFLLPYLGALTSSPRGRDYLRFLGIAGERIFLGYSTLSITRIQALSGAAPAPEGTPFNERVFVVAAQLISAVSLAGTLAAYQVYRDLVAKPRPLRIISSGALDQEVCQKIDELEKAYSVTISGGIQPNAVLEELSKAIALILYGGIDPSEKIVPQAQCLGLPILLSETYGASVDLVRSGANGFVVEEDNPRGLAYFMSLLSEDADLWKKMCGQAQKSSHLSDVENFVSGVESLIKVC